MVMGLSRGFSSVQLSRSVVSDSLRPHGLQRLILGSKYTCEPWEATRKATGHLLPSDTVY